MDGSELGVGGVASGEQVVVDAAGGGADLAESAGLGDLAVEACEFVPEPACLLFSPFDDGGVAVVEDVAVFLAAQVRGGVPGVGRSPAPRLKSVRSPDRRRFRPPRKTLVRDTIGHGLGGESMAAVPHTCHTVPLFGRVLARAVRSARVPGRDHLRSAAR